MLPGAISTSAAKHAKNKKIITWPNECIFVNKIKAFNVAVWGEVECFRIIKYLKSLLFVT